MNKFGLKALAFVGYPVTDFAKAREKGTIGTENSRPHELCPEPERHSHFLVPMFLSRNPGTRVGRVDKKLGTRKWPSCA